MPSLSGLPVGVAVRGALEDLRGRRDLGLGGLQDRVGAGAGPGRERQAEVAVVGVFGRDPLALPVRELAGERVVPGGEVLDPLAGVGGWLAWGQGEIVALGWGGGFGFGGAQRGERLAGVAAAQFGVGGYGLVALWRVACSQAVRSAITVAKTSSRWR